LEEEGYHTTARGKTHDWNQDLITCVEMHTKNDLPNFDLEVSKSLDQLTRDLCAAFFGYIDICRSLQAPIYVLRAISSRHEILDVAAAVSKNKFNQEYGFITRNAVLSRSDSFVTKTMRKTYGDAFRDKGMQTFSPLAICDRSLTFAHRQGCLRSAAQRNPGAHILQ
jgi:hypothetical protein